MQYRSHHGVLLSEIGIGCYGLSGAYGVRDVDRYIRTIRAAFERGVTFFDTAEAYGQAEHVLGEAVAPFRRDVLVASKVGVREGLEPNLSAGYIVGACERSLTQLGMEYIDLYQVHFDDPGTPVAETVEALEGLKKAGKIRAYGVGHIPADRVKEYLEIGGLFSVLVEMSAVSRDALKQVVPLCETAGTAVIAFSITGRGVLTGGITRETRFSEGDIRRIDPLFQRERFESALRVADYFARIGAEYGRTGVQIAIAWVLAQPRVVCALTGPSSVEHLDENLAASGLTLDPAHLQEIADFLSEEDTLLVRQLGAATREILAKPNLGGEPTAFEDLVYAAESAIQLAWVTEEAIFPVFRDLFALRGTSEGHGARKALNEIQSRMARIVRPAD